MGKSLPRHCVNHTGRSTNDPKPPCCPAFRLGVLFPCTAVQGIIAVTPIPLLLKTNVSSSSFTRSLRSAPHRGHTLVSALAPSLPPICPSKPPAALYSEVTTPSSSAVDYRRFLLALAPFNPAPLSPSCALPSAPSPSPAAANLLSAVADKPPRQ